MYTDLCKWNNFDVKYFFRNFGFRNRCYNESVDNYEKIQLIKLQNIKNRFKRCSHSWVQFDYVRVKQKIKEQINSCSNSSALGVKRFVKMPDLFFVNFFTAYVGKLTDLFALAENIKQEISLFLSTFEHLSTSESY